ncbi:putative Benzoate carboxyl methyltransferase [Hibiscus syriacus]|uniref:Benzoate carboxyl methyltransferase n=1 Tax=Hibiscus syriacus TaxID=106335 RepID=A0A6A3C541_HIBSY|nr:programmed cell death protein 2-like [Hibiscus syriacus]KAE8722342.1 putative Benzoate carboxyl methyltransferase [Hibiscus syriacus]
MSVVLLGLPGPWAEDSREPSDHYTTKIGGLPDWPLPIGALNLNPTLIHCTQCGSKLCLVAQLYAPVSSGALNIEDRLLLVFGCVIPNCGSSPLSWRVLRIQKVETESKESSSSATLHKPPAASSTVSVSKTNWWENLSDEDDEDVDLKDLSKAFSEAASLISEPKKTNNNRNFEGAMKHSSLTAQTRVDTDTPVMPCFYIYSQVESSSKDFASVCSNHLSLSVKEKEGDADDHEQEETWEAENYEYDKALNADRTYLKFKKQLDAYPEQCFRYEFGGKPLLATAEVGNAGNCGLCGSSRHFELQLMPPLIYFLQEETDLCRKGSLENWNWLTLTVYTCSKSCSKSFDEEKSTCGAWFVVEETVIMQFDEKPINEWLQRYFS